MNSNKQQGNVFESHIESLYQGLGYKTKRNEIVFGQEIDIVAEKQIDGAGTIKLLIECKYLSSGKISNQIVFDFLSYIKSLPDNLDITKGVMVTNKNYSPQASIISDKKLSLTTLDELEKEVLNLNNPFVIIKQNYEHEDIYNDYISLSGKIIEFEDFQQYEKDQSGTVNYQEEKSVQSKKERIIKEVKNIENWFIHQIKYYPWNRWSYISILGDYGTGKTTLMKRLFYLLIVESLKQQLNLKPIYLELKSFYKFQSLDLFIQNAFAILFGKEVSIQLLQKEIENGKIIFLIDGFDEMTPQISQDIRLKNFKTLAPILTSSSPCIISCRPSYFVSTDEYRMYLSAKKKSEKMNLDFDAKHHPTTAKKAEHIQNTYLKLFNKYFVTGESEIQVQDGLTVILNELDESQIVDYLEKYDEQFLLKCHASSHEIRVFLSSIYDLSELMTKPLLLSIIKDTILMLGDRYKEKNSLDFSPASLYEIYTTINLDFDWQKGEIRQFLTKEERRQFAEAIAIAMFDKNILDVSYEDLKQVAKSESIILERLNERLPKVTPENIVSDIQICAFVTKTLDDNFKFVHKSFMEFFVARALKSKIIELKDAKLEERLVSINFPKEILYFLGSFALIEDKLKSLLFKSWNKGINNTFKRNIAVAYLHSSLKHTNLKLSSVRLDEISLSRIEIVNSEFLKIDFYKNNWRRLSIRDSKVERVMISFSEILESTIINSIGKLDVRNSVLRKTEFHSTETLFVHFENSTISICSFTSTSLIVDDNNPIEDSSFLKAQLLFLKSQSLAKCKLESCSIQIMADLGIHKCTLVNVTFSIDYHQSQLSILDSLFENCVIEGADVNFIDNFEMTFNDCTGYVFTEPGSRDAKSAKSFFKGSGVKIIGNLLIVNLSKYRTKYSDHKNWVRKIIEKSYKSWKASTASYKN